MNKTNIKKNIRQALQMFGPMEFTAILAKLKLRSIDVRTWEVEQILHEMHRERIVIEATGFKNGYLLRSL